jgi:enamine deaminase RidA (YjgF/YER057c/UK114 family)
MHGTSLSFLPFDNVWKMRIEHPYSLIVKEGGLLWSCGQCPLDAEGAVLFAGDLLAQAGAVAGFIERYLGEMACAVSDIARLVVYYVKTLAGDAEALASLFHARLGPTVVILPVAVPHFYYDGMLIEVDVYGSVSQKASLQHVDDTTGMRLSVVDAGPFVWANLIVPGSHADAGAVAEAAERLIAQAGLSQERLLADQWFDCGLDVSRVLGTSGFCSTPGGTVRTPFDGIGASAELTFSETPVSLERHVMSAPSFPGSRVVLTFRQSSTHFHIAAADESGTVNIVGQTAAVMEAIDLLFQEKNLGFADVRKATTYYVSGSTAEELHDNMSIRNRYYGRPGPASTGLPVEAFASAQTSIRLQLLGACRPSEPV